MARHGLKTWPEFYEKVEDGSKTFELRKNDRGFKVGDTLVLQEWDPIKKEFTGRQLERTVSYMLEGFEVIRASWCILALAEPAKGGE